MMTATQVLRMERLATDAKAWHQQTLSCERPATCGACHWWAGYLAALDEIRRGVDPSGDELSPALQQARTRIAVGQENRHRLLVHGFPGAPSGDAP